MPTAADSRVSIFCALLSSLFASLCYIMAVKECVIVFVCVGWGGVGWGGGAHMHRNAAAVVKICYVL